MHAIQDAYAPPPQVMQEEALANFQDRRSTNSVEGVDPAIDHFTMKGFSLDYNTSTLGKGRNAWVKATSICTHTTQIIESALT